MPEAGPTAFGAPHDRARPLVVLAFDVGARRIGVARGDTLTRSTAPLGSVGTRSGVPHWTEIEALVREWQPGRLVVGLPYNVDGSDSRQTIAARAFARELARRHAVPVELVDERYSSLEAQERLRAARRSGSRARRVSKADVDAAAACIILERWLSGGPSG